MLPLSVDFPGTSDVASISGKCVALSVVHFCGDTIVLFDVGLSWVVNVLYWQLRVVKLPLGVVVMLPVVKEPFGGVVAIVWGTLELFEDIISGIVGSSIFNSAPSKIHWYMFSRV